MSINLKNTKAEILAAYKELEKQKKSLEVQLKNPAKTSTIAVTNTKILPNIQSSASRDINISKIIKSLEHLQIGFGGAVSNLSEQLIAEATELTEIRIAIATSRDLLKTLHELANIDEHTLDSLINKYQQNAKNFTEELELQQEVDELEIQEITNSWKKEIETHARFINTRNEEYRKQQQRESEEYQYNLDLARDLDEGEYEQEKKQRQKQLEMTRQELEKQWQQKEVSIAKQEQEYAAAQAKIAAFEEQLKAKIKQGQEEGKGIGTYQAKVKAELRIKEVEGEKQNYQLRIQDLEQTISNQQVRINQLSQQLAAALKQVQDLAVKAIEGTSNRNSFEAMKAIAIEQAKMQSKGK